VIWAAKATLLKIKRLITRTETYFMGAPTAGGLFVLEDATTKNSLSEV
jgi:hypothetical protein